LSAVAAAAVGALIPAIVAARTKPVDILRYE
jgi:ABC-type antimicrobial peptide transport system permease subunit